MQPLLEPGDLIGVVVGDIVVGPHIFSPAGPSLAIALFGAVRGQLVGQRVHGCHDAVLAQVVAAVLRPAALECGGEFGVGVEFVPPEWYQLGVARVVEDVVVLVDPGVGAPCVIVVGVAIGQVVVPHDHLEAGILAVAALEELAAQAVTVYVVPQLHGELVIDEILHVQELPIGGLAHGPVIPQGSLHLVDAPVDVAHLVGRHVLVIWRLVLEMDVLVIERCARTAHGVVLGAVGHFAVGAVHLHDVAAGDGVALFARIRQIQSVFAGGNDLSEDVHAIIDAVQEQLAIAALGRVFHPRP